MCCFAGAMDVNVSGTNIFARMLDTAPGHQVLAYSMSLEVDTEVAMVLPLPVLPGAGEDALRFIDLSAFPDMFRDLARLFEVRLLGPSWDGELQAHDLEVHEVGSFVASYVPSRADFARLDPRFRIADALFDAVPQYADYGFAVFQLAPGRTTVHPMAFSFPTRHPDHIYFPTVHVHDGTFHNTVRFDHSLYYQHAPAYYEAGGRLGRDEISDSNLERSYRGIAAAGHQVVRRELHGTYVNEDVWIPTAA